MEEIQEDIDEGNSLVINVHIVMSGSYEQPIQDIDENSNSELKENNFIYSCNPKEEIKEFEEVKVPNGVTENTRREDSK